MKYTVNVGGETVEVEFERTPTGIHATIGDRIYALEISSRERGAYWLNWDQQSIEVFVTPTGDTWSVSIGSHTIPVEILDARKKLKRSARQNQSSTAEVRAPMPGKIVRVLVSEGADVELHQGIIVMEAMKMQNEIKSPIRGRIQKLAVNEGATIRAGELIAIVS